MKSDARHDPPEFIAGQRARSLSLDLIRASAISLVIFCHAYPFWPHSKFFFRLAYFAGIEGVEIFFVLSGFLVGGLLYENLQSDRRVGRWLLDFCVRRWMRTLPNYYLFLAVSVGLAYFASGIIPEFRLHLFLVQNLLWEAPLHYIESWSLTVEELFYLVFPVTLLLWAKSALPPTQSFIVACGTLLFSCSCIRLYATLDGPERTFNMGMRLVALFRLDSLAIGAIAYMAWRNYAPRKSVTLIVALGLVTISAMALASLFGDLDKSVFWKVFWTPINSTGIAFAIIFLMKTNFIPDFLRPSITAISRWSYSMYLVNLPMTFVIGLAFQATTSFPIQMSKIVLFIVGTLIVSSLVYRNFELPMTSLREKFRPPNYRAASAT
jgi:peptidoglycan/LPS O-acetylase OafA/YrhL